MTAGMLGRCNVALAAAIGLVVATSTATILSRGLANDFLPAAAAAAAGISDPASELDAAPLPLESHLFQSTPHALFLPYVGQGPSAFPTVVAEVGERRIVALTATDGRVYQAVRGPYQLVDSKPMAETVLEVIDVSHPGEPRLLGTSPPVESRVIDVAANGAYAYLLCDPVEQDALPILTIVDVGRPARPQPAGRIEVAGHTIAVVDHYAYVGFAGYLDLSVLDVADAANPRRVHMPSVEDSMPRRGDLFAHGNYIIALPDTDQQLTVYDRHDATNPRIVAQLDIAPRLAADARLAVDSRAAYAVFGGSDWGPPSISIFDLASPTEPRLVGRMADASDHIGEVSSIAVGGHRLYVAQRSWSYDAHLNAFDVEPPERIRSVGIGQLTGYNNLLAAGESGELVFTTSPYDGLGIWRRGSAAPRKAAHYPVLGEIEDTAVVGDAAYLATKSGLGVVSLTHPTTPRPLSHIDLGGSPKKVTADGARAYVVVEEYTDFVTEGNVRLDVVDVANPRRPTVSGSLVLMPADYSRPWADEARMEVRDNVVWQLREPRTLIAVDMSDPSVPRELSRTSLEHAAHSLVLGSDRAFVVVSTTSGTRVGITAIDISDPPNPVEIATSEYPRVRHPYIHPFELCLDGLRLYALTDQELLIHDVSDPADIQPISRTPLGVLPTSLAVSGQTAYLTGRHNLLHLYSVRDPSHPREIGRMPTAGYSKVSDVGRYVYLTSERLEIVDPGL